MKYIKLNDDWNAEPNAPEVALSVEENKLKVQFELNWFIFHNPKEEGKGELTFHDCHKYNFIECNEQDYQLGKHRYNADILPWGEFYELQHDWTKDFPADSKIISQPVNGQALKHYIFFFRDKTLECIAKDVEFRRK